MYQSASFKNLFNIFFNNFIIPAYLSLSRGLNKAERRISVKEIIKENIFLFTLKIINVL